MIMHKDIAYMEMAYGLAERAKGWASPNPYVGAVLVRKDIIVGYGYHEKPGKPHAEIIALQRAGQKSRNSTAYITLEPCIHWGRTPPCIDSILQAGLKRVVVSSLDPNPLVNKKGVRIMQGEGLDVSVGLLGGRNKRLNESYFKYIREKIPFVTVKAAASLDGKIATKSGSSQWISSPPVREYTQLLRGEHDAIMVGINTVLKDDPLLTVRHRNWRDKRLVRVILDSKLRFPLQSRMLDTLSKGDICIFTSQHSSTNKVEALRQKGASVIPLSGRSSSLKLEDILLWLGGKEISSVLVEGGSLLVTSILEKKLADKILVALSPKLIGGKDALSLYGGRGVNHVKDAHCMKRVRSFRIADETIVEGYF
ncbi:bifunctional diaminohydroxyphosphoribosylaminopyrimidine deaminase/5-amino-6-(5-phosphoribosylamino)uracil reductase RibD [Acidobacteriota bacterium]